MTMPNPKESRDNWFSRHKFIAKLILITFGIFFPLSCLELGSYLIGKFPLAPDPLVTESISQWLNLRTFDSLLFWKLRPNLKVRIIETNSLGLRSKEISGIKENEFRILSLGESSTFGMGVKQEDTYSALIEKDLESVNGKSLHVINAGMPGYSLFQGFMYLKHRGIKLKPDAVMIYFGYNDFLPVAFLSRRDALLTEETTGLNDWELFEQKQKFFPKMKIWLTERSNFVRGLMTLFQSELNPKSIGKNEKKFRVPPEHRRRLLEMFHNFCAEENIHFIIVVPWYLYFTRHEALLREYATKSGIPILDLPDKLQHHSEVKKKYFRDNLHPNRRGHRLIAQAITEELSRLWEENGLLKEQQ